MQGFVLKMVRAFVPFILSRFDVVDTENNEVDNYFTNIFDFFGMKKSFVFVLVANILELCKERRRSAPLSMV